MDLTVTGTLPSLASTLTSTGIGTQLPLLGENFPPIDIKNFPSPRVDFELFTPLAIDTGASEKQVTMLSSNAKILTRLEAQVDKCVDISEITSRIPLAELSGNVNIKGGFVTEALFDFRLGPQYGTATIVSGTPPTVSFAYDTPGSGTVTPSGGYKADFQMPMPKDGGDVNPITFDRSISFHVSDNNMFDENVTPCVKYDLGGSVQNTNQCAGYVCHSSRVGSWVSYCYYDLCDWVGASYLPWALQYVGMSSYCPASPLVAPGAGEVSDVCTVSS